MAEHHTSPARDPQQFADFCQQMIERYAPATSDRRVAVAA